MATSHFAFNTRDCQLLRTITTNEIKIINGEKYDVSITKETVHDLTFSACDSIKKYLSDVNTSTKELVSIDVKENTVKHYDRVSLYELQKMRR